MSVQYTAIFHGCKNDKFQMKFFDIFLIFAQNIDCGYTLEPPQRGSSNEYPQSIIDCGYTLEPPQRGSSNEYPQSMFWSKNKKNMYT